MFFSIPFLTLCLLSSVIAAPAAQDWQRRDVGRANGQRHRFQTRDWLQQPAKRQDPNQAQREQAQHEKERQEQQQREQAQHERERQEQRQREQAQNGGTATGQTTNGQTTNGQTTNNQPTTSQPATNQPATNQPAINQPATNQPAAKKQYATTGGNKNSQKLKSGGSAIPEITNSETLNSETTNPGETSQSGTSQPETTQQETTQPETSQSNNGTTTPAKTTGGATGGGGSSAGGTGVKGTHHAFGGPGSCEISDGSKTDGSANHLCAVGAKGGKWDISPNPDYHQRPSYCNKKITITNKGAESDGAGGNVGSEGQSTTCTVVDSYGSDTGQVDISDSAWKELTGMQPGILNIDWQWLDDPHSTEFLSSGGA